MMHRIFRDRSGTSGIEFALVAPIILLLFFGAITVFDLYRSYWQLVQATYIVSDVVTRETAIDEAYVDRVYGVYTNLFNDKVSPTALRVSSISKKKTGYVVLWTTQRGDTSLIPTQQIQASKLPDIAETDTIIVVEGFSRKVAASGYLGFLNMKFAEETYGRPRFINAIAMVK